VDVASHALTRGDARRFSRFKAPKPRFAALVGNGSLDYRDLMGLGGNWLPPALAPTAGGLFPSEQLLTEGASAGVSSATGWSNHFETDLLRTAFAEAVFASEAETIGEAMIRAHKAATDASVPQHRVYMLLGDPALRLRSAPAQPDPEPLPPMDSTPGSTPDANPGPVGAGDDPAASALGCEIAPSGAGHGPYGLGVLLLGAVLLIRRRRASPQRRSDLH
jgi:MYXO-CTERM domain-containing protein